MCSPRAKRLPDSSRKQAYFNLSSAKSYIKHNLEKANTLEEINEDKAKLEAKKKERPRN